MFYVIWISNIFCLKEWLIQKLLEGSDSVEREKYSQKRNVSLQKKYIMINNTTISFFEGGGSKVVNVETSCGWKCTKLKFVLVRFRYSLVKFCTYLLKAFNQNIFTQRTSFIYGRLQSKVVFHQRSTSINSCLPSKVIFHQRASWGVYEVIRRLVYRCRVSIYTVDWSTIVEFLYTR